MLQCRQSLKTLRQVKDVRHKRLYILGFHLCNIFRIGKSTQTGSRLGVPMDWRGGEWEVLIGYGFLFGVMKLVWKSFVTEVVVVQHYEHTKRHWIVHFKMVLWTLGEFNLNEKNTKRQVKCLLSGLGCRFPQLRNRFWSAHTWKTRLMLLRFQVWAWRHG